MTQQSPRFFSFFALALRRPKVFFRTYFKEQQLGWPFLPHLLIGLFVLSSLGIGAFFLLWKGAWEEFAPILFKASFEIGKTILYTVSISLVFARLAGVKFRHWMTVLKIAFYRWYIIILFFLLAFIVSFILGVIAEILGFNIESDIFFLLGVVVMACVVIYLIYFNYAGLITLTTATLESCITATILSTTLGLLFKAIRFCTPLAVEFIKTQ